MTDHYFKFILGFDEADRRRAGRVYFLKKSGNVVLVESSNGKACSYYGTVHHTVWGNKDAPIAIEFFQWCEENNIPVSDDDPNTPVRIVGPLDVSKAVMFEMMWL